jgi:hypothetical protein
MPRTEKDDTGAGHGYQREVGTREVDAVGVQQGVEVSTGDSEASTRPRCSSRRALLGPSFWLPPGRAEGSSVLGEDVLRSAVTEVLMLVIRFVESCFRRPVHRGFPRRRS